MSAKPSVWRAAVRYGLAGLLNTAVGFSAVLVFDLWVGLSSSLANLLGNLVGIIASFFLSRLFVFADRKTGKSSAVRYAVAVIAALGAAQLTILIGRPLVEQLGLGVVTLQGAAAVAYSGSLFLLSHYWVFAARAPD